ncbi:MAG: tetratricopeptide repeat protein, partial [Kofleriaceae bacterium]
MLSRARALARLGRFDEADRALDLAGGKTPGGRALLRERAHIAIARGRLADAIRVFDPLTQGSSAEPVDLNFAAWLRIAAGQDLDGAVALARRAMGSNEDKSPPAIANTLA